MELLVKRHHEVEEVHRVEVEGLAEIVARVLAGTAARKEEGVAV